MAAKKRIDECVIAIDAGTQSVRAAAVDMSGNIVHMVKLPIESYVSPRPGWAEQDADYFWRMLCSACKSMMKDIPFHQQAIKGVALTSQRATFVNVDKAGNPLRPAIVWMDQRKAKVEAWPEPLMRLGLGALGILEPVLHTIRDCELNWIRQNQPQVWERTYKFLLISGYYTFKLTGEFRDSIGCTEGYFPFDYKKQVWASRRDIKWKMFPIEPEKLWELIPPAGVLGYVTATAAKETGLPAGLPVIAAAADKACEALGAGCIEPNVGCISYGTTATIDTVTRKYTEIVPFFPPYPAALPAAYNTEFMIYRGYWMVSWFKKEFGLAEDLLSKKTGVSTEQLFEEEAKLIPAGSLGLILQPFWSPGVKIPGPEAKGCMIGFGDVHTKAHMYRAIIEGMAYALKEGGQLTEKRTGVKMKSLLVAGGGSQSSLTMQVTADVFNLPARRPHTFEASVLGAAIDAAVGLGLYGDFPSAVAGMTRVKDEFEPLPAARDIYSELYEKVYLKTYKKLKPLYKRIRGITGYPDK